MCAAEMRRALDSRVALRPCRAVSRSQKRQTPLMRAVKNKSGGVARLLLESGANVFAVDDHGLTALDYAEGFKCRCNSVVQELVSRASVPRGLAFRGTRMPSSDRACVCVCAHGFWVLCVVPSCAGALSTAVMPDARLSASDDA